MNNSSSVCIRKIAFIFFVSFIVANSSSVVAAEENVEDVMFIYFSEDELVETATRSPKPLIHVAENVTIITQKEIESLNAHNLAEVLQRVSGLFVSFTHMDFGGQAKLRIHGLQTNHAIVLLDGVRLNNSSGGDVLLDLIPVHIIKKIEIIKGPASSTWGSALGGVVNIFTKDTGNSVVPEGTASASYGERQTQDYYLDVAGKDYYFHANQQKSDGLRFDRHYDNEQFYGKIDLEVPTDTNFYITLGHSAPENKWGDFFGLDEFDTAVNRNTFGSANFDLELASGVDFHIAVQLFKQNFMNEARSLGQTANGPFGALIFNNIWDEQTVTTEARLSIDKGRHTAVFGAEIIRGEVDFTNNNGAFFQSFGFPATFQAETAKEEKWGIYANDTMQLGIVTLTPGIRYDHHSISKNFVSPSLGVVIPAGKDTIFRLTSARGFAYPFLTATAVDSPVFEAHPDLEPEEIYSVQGDVETKIIPYTYLKTTLFQHWVKDAWKDELLPSFLIKTVNSDDSERKGVEVTIKTVSVYNFNFEASYTYVHKLFESDQQNDDIYETNLALAYDDDHMLRVKLLGRYVWWDLERSDFDIDTDYSRFIWDLFFGITVFSNQNRSAELFGSIRNLFNGSHFWDEDFINPRRWIEAGVKINF